MRMTKLSMLAVGVLMCVMSTTGCTRALRDGVSVGVTDGLSDGISTLVSDLIGSVSGGGA